MRHDRDMPGPIVHTAAALLLAALLTGCGSAAFPPGTIVVGGVRPVPLVQPPDHDPTEPTPLIVVLHGYGGDAARMERVFPLASGAAVAGALLVYPQGSANRLGSRFWNASLACCDLFGSGVDDVAYLMALIAEVEVAVAVDRVVLFGHSNGGFMAYRLACEFGDRLAAVVTVAGALDDPPPDCGAPSPARMLHVHGTQDGVVPYDGGSLFTRPRFTGAERTVATLATRAGCTGALQRGAPFDLDTAVTGSETVPFEAAGCPDGHRVMLWAVEGAAHEPTVSSGFAARVLGFALGN
jgi:polyhydroxybutyrate depolymerase